jgi:hypothetical protein
VKSRWIIRKWNYGSAGIQGLDTFFLQGYDWGKPEASWLSKDQIRDEQIEHSARLLTPRSDEPSMVGTQLLPWHLRPPTIAANVAAHVPRCWRSLRQLTASRHCTARDPSNHVGRIADGRHRCGLLPG